jgi:hypothetical protein
MPTRQAAIREPIREDVRRRVLALLERVKAREAADDLATREGLAENEAKAIVAKNAKLSLQSTRVGRVSCRPVSSGPIAVRAGGKRK